MAGTNSCAEAWSEVSWLVLKAELLLPVLLCRILWVLQTFPTRLAYKTGQHTIINACICVCPYVTHFYTYYEV